MCLQRDLTRPDNLPWELTPRAKKLVSLPKRIFQFMELNHTTSQWRPQFSHITRSTNRQNSIHLLQITIKCKLSLCQMLNFTYRNSIRSQASLPDKLVTTENSTLMKTMSLTQMTFPSPRSSNTTQNSRKDRLSVASKARTRRNLEETDKRA